MSTTSIQEPIAEPDRRELDPLEAIPLTTMDHHDPRLFGELMVAIERVAATGGFTGGAAVERLEADYAAWWEVGHAPSARPPAPRPWLPAGPGYRAGRRGRGPGEDSFIATAEAVSLVGARPRFADVDADTQLLTAQTLRAALAPAVRCVIPVHLFGRTVDMDPILELARAEGLAVVEDAAQAHGARYRGRRVGTLGDAGTFSFYPSRTRGWGTPAR